MASDARGYVCKICDFGLARVLTSSSAAAGGGGGEGGGGVGGAKSSRSGSLPTSLSVAAAITSAAAAHPAFTHVSTHTHGTLAYQAPEVISQGRVGRPADIFSLGILAAEVLSGWKPFRALPLGAVVHAIVYSHERNERERGRDERERERRKRRRRKRGKEKEERKLFSYKKTQKKLKTQNLKTGRACPPGALRSSRTSSAAAGPRTQPRGRGPRPSWQR